MVLFFVFNNNRLNEDMMESLFGCNNNGMNSSATKPKEQGVRKSVLPNSVDHENKVLDPKKSQNIAILLRALNVTRDEVSEALLDGKLTCFLYSLPFMVPSSILH
jgi:hypothetical protein